MSMGKRKGIRSRRGYILFGLAFCLCIAVFGFTVSARDSELNVSAHREEGMPEGYEDLPQYLPDDVRELLPEEIESRSTEEVGQAVEELSDVRYILNIVSEALAPRLRESVAFFAKLVGLLVLAAIFSAVKNSLGSDALSGAVRFCTTSAIFAAIIQTQLEHLKSVQVFFERLTSLMNAMVPIAGTVWAMGGNVTTASSGTATLSVFLLACENMFAKTVMPICCVSIALALCNTMSPEMGLKGFTGAIKKLYTFCLGMIMMLLVSCLGAQTTLTAAADSTTARAAKMVSSTVIPVVGGSVGDTLRTVASSVQYLKSIVGISGIVFIFLLVLPTLLSLLLTRFAFILGTSVAEILGCDSESRLLAELGNVYGCMIAAVSISSVMFILAFNIFVRTVVALM